jgi:hypothetical protein
MDIISPPCGCEDGRNIALFVDFMLLAAIIQYFA